MKILMTIKNIYVYFIIKMIMYPFTSKLIIFRIITITTVNATINLYDPDSVTTYNNNTIIISEKANKYGLEIIKE